MITPDELEQSMQRLKVKIPPPAHPVGLDATGLPDDLPPLPPDMFQFAEVYGSGFFDDGGILVAVLNPFEKGFAAKQDRDLELLRDLKETEGDEYIPYVIYPDQGGILPWGYSDRRKHYLWLTEGEPMSWPVMAMYDIEITRRFDMPMVVFLDKLLCGEIDCSFLGLVDSDGNRINRIDPTSVCFTPRILPT